MTAPSPVNTRAYAAVLREADSGTLNHASLITTCWALGNRDATQPPGTKVQCRHVQQESTCGEPRETRNAAVTTATHPEN